MKKTIYFKTLFLLCTLLAGVVSTHAQDYDYEWVKITDLSQVESGETVLLVDVNKEIALPNNSIWFTGVSVTINDNGTVVDDEYENIKWTLTKNEDGSFSFKRADGQYLCGVLGSDPKFEVGATGEMTTSFNFDNYGENGGEFRYLFTNYLKWEKNGDNYRAVVSTSGSDITLYKRAIKNYVKWKRVGIDNIDLINGDTIVIVDLKSGRALSNDKADKDPDAVALTLNDDMDRIVMDEVPEKVQWKYSRTEGKGMQFKTKDDKYLIKDTDNKALKVGEGTDDNSYFTYGHPNNKNDLFRLYTYIGNDPYMLDVEESMFSNTWKLVEMDDYDGDYFAIFKKIEDAQKVVKIELAEYYDTYLGEEEDNKLNLNVKYTGAEFSEISWASSKTDVATVAPGINAVWEDDGVVTLKKRGTTVITASVGETISHDKASAKCTVRIDDLESEVPGSMNNPLTVEQAKELAEKGKVTVNGTQVKWEAGVNYYIKGKVSKVNSGLMAMFGDMDFGEMMGGNGGDNMDFEDSMDDIDFDMDEMGEMGIDMSSFSGMGFDMSAMFGSSDKVTYYISDDGTKDNQLKVLNGCGELDCITDNVITYQACPKLSPGDCVIVYGPLIESEDSNMFSNMMGNDNEEPKTSWKVGEQNYMFVYDPTLLVNDTTVYVNKTLNPDGLYEIDNLFDFYEINETKITGGMQNPTFKSSDEDIAKWDEEKNVIIGVNEGKAKITVKIKVIVTPDDESTTDTNEEKSYTMKRKFKLNVRTRDLDPAGYYDGDYVLTTSTDDLVDGTRLILVSTRVKDDKETDYAMVENNAMMGGGKNGSKIEIDDPDKIKIPCEDVPNGTLEIVLEQDENDADIWYLNVGKDENNNNLYLYASDSSEDENPEEEGNGGMNSLMNMFSSNSGLKVATKEVAGDSCKAVIAFADDIATIKFPTTEGKNNTIMLGSSFDMEEMMKMFSSEENEENNEGNEGDEGDESGSTFDMGSFDMFMASFNTKKTGDEKSFMPRIYRFVPDPTFDITIGSTEWRTIVTYKNVEIPENVEAYVVTKVNQEEGESQSWANLKEVVTKQLKGGEPYLLHRTSGGENYTMTVLDDDVDVSAPKKNLLQVSAKIIAGESGNTSVYVLAKKNAGVGFYRWVGGLLGAGRVYLPVEASVTANEYCAFVVDQTTEQTTAIQSIEDSKTNIGPFYDLQGRRVNQPQQKGIYINNGKKVVVK